MSFAQSFVVFLFFCFFLTINVHDVTLRVCLRGEKSHLEEAFFFSCEKLLPPLKTYAGLSSGTGLGPTPLPWDERLKDNRQEEDVTAVPEWTEQVAER